MRIGSLSFSICLALGLALAGCATGRQADPGAVVTRFHLGQPIARGTLAIEPVEAGQEESLEFAQIATPVEQELTRLGWTVVRDERSEQVALVDVRRGARENFADRPAVSIGVGGGTGGWGRGGVGVGVGATFPVGSRRADDIIVTELAVRLHRRSDGTAIWEGRARTEARAGDPLANLDMAAARLAEALFEGFPGESGRTISVP